MSRIEDDLLNYESKYEKNGVLVNKLGIDDANTLEKVERVATSYKLTKLFLENEKQDFDVNHYLSIHKYLFEDIYPFAGEIRNENIKKQIPFCLPNLIYPNLEETLRKAKQDSDRINSREELVDFLAYYYAELDIIHPFREGNGRCEREFLRQYTDKICRDNNIGDYSLNYDLIEDKDAFIKSVIIADSTCDTTYLKEFINHIVVSKNVKHK